MKKFSALAALAAFAAFAAPASATDWKSVAVYSGKKVNNVRWWGAIATGGTEASALAAAMSECEQSTGRTCGKKITTTVPMEWFLVASVCNGRGATGASQSDFYAANTRAAIKLGYADGSSCTILKAFPPGCANEECMDPEFLPR